MHDQGVDNRRTSDPAAQEALLEKLLRTGQKEKAVKLLCQLAAVAARGGLFDRAEAFRDRLYEVDSMALSAIVKVNEVIEAEKNKALTPERKRLWGRFFEGLSTQEAHAFFFALREIHLGANEVLLRQGQSNDRLFLVEQGQLKFVHEGADKQLLIHSIGRGDICGQDTFFSINVCTATVTALTAARLHCIDRERLEGITLQLPLFEAHLQRACGGGRSIYDRLRQKGQDRRVHKRIHFQTRAFFQILSAENGKAMQREVAAELWDISKSGLSFYFQSKNAQAVRRLVGMTVRVRFEITVSGRTKWIVVAGVVQGVQSHPLDEFSVHVKLNRLFSDQAIRTIHQVAGFT